MARVMEALPRELEVTIKLNAKATASIYVLLQMGLFGKTAEEIIDEMLRFRLRQLVLEGWIRR